jgi:hypothetical protein
MRMYFSEKKNIGILEMANDVTINFTADDPIKYIYVSAKTRDTKSKIVETIRDLVEPSKFKSSLKRNIKKIMDDKELDRVSKLIKKYMKNGKLTQVDVKAIAKEIDKK